MTVETANKIYDVLVEFGGANETMRNSFIYHHSESKDVCTEWRFSGKLGFGGKYHSQTNKVDCYREDETPERNQLITEINTLLASV